MASDIRLLEDLVNKAVDRLKQLSEERSELRLELEGLRRQLEQVDEARGSQSREERQLEEAGWRIQREQVLTVLRDTLEELRSD